MTHAQLAATERFLLHAGHDYAEVPAQIVIAADAHAIDEHQRRGLDRMFGLEGLGLHAGGEPLVVDGVSLSCQQFDRLDPIRTDMCVHHHAMDGRVLAGFCVHLIGSEACPDADLHATVRSEA